MTGVRDGGLVGHSGLTYAVWQQQRIDDYLAGRRATLWEPHDFDREFLADRDGMMPPIVAVVNAVTGQPVQLPEPIRVHVDDLDRVLAEFQARFLDEWHAQHPACACGQGGCGVS